MQKDCGSIKNSAVRCLQKRETRKGLLCTRPPACPPAETLSVVPKGKDLTSWRIMQQKTSVMCTPESRRVPSPTRNTPHAGPSRGGQHGSHRGRLPRPPPPPLPSLPQPRPWLFLARPTPHERAPPAVAVAAEVAVAGDASVVVVVAPQEAPMMVGRRRGLSRDWILETTGS